MDGLISCQRKVSQSVLGQDAEPEVAHHASALYGSFSIAVCFECVERETLQSNASEVENTT